MKEVIVSLLLWINAHSGMGYDPSLGLPDLERVSPEVLVTKRFKDDVPETLSAPGIDRLKVGLLAIYNNDNSTIYVSDHVDLDSARGHAVLLHELVHFVQFRQGHQSKVPCVNALEKDAYELQTAFMEGRGLVPEFDRFTVAVRSACWGDY